MNHIPEVKKMVCRVFEYSGGRTEERMHEFSPTRIKDASGLYYRQCIWCGQKD